MKRRVSVRALVRKEPQDRKVLQGVEIALGVHPDLLQNLRSGLLLYDKEQDTLGKPCEGLAQDCLGCAESTFTRDFQNRLNGWQPRGHPAENEVAACNPIAARGRGGIHEKNFWELDSLDCVCSGWHRESRRLCGGISSHQGTNRSDPGPGDPDTSVVGKPAAFSRKTTNCAF